MKLTIILALVSCVSGERLGLGKSTSSRHVTQTGRELGIKEDFGAWAGALANDWNAAVSVLAAALPYMFQLQL